MKWSEPDANPLADVRRIAKQMKESNKVLVHIDADGNHFYTEEETK